MKIDIPIDWLRVQGATELASSLRVGSTVYLDHLDDTSASAKVVDANGALIFLLGEESLPSRLPPTHGKASVRTVKRNKQTNDILSIILRAVEGQRVQNSGCNGCSATDGAAPRLLREFDAGDDDEGFQLQRVQLERVAHDERCVMRLRDLEAHPYDVVCAWSVSVSVSVSLSLSPSIRPFFYCRIRRFLRDPRLQAVITDIDRRESDAEAALQARMAGDEAFREFTDLILDLVDHQPN